MKFSADTFEKFMGFLGEVIHSVNILKTGQLITEAQSDEERVALSHALSGLLRVPSFSTDPYGHNNGYGPQYY